MSETPSRPLTPAERAQRQAAGLKHGARSDGQIRPVARTQKRRLLRQIGIAASDLTGIGPALLDNWARAQAKVELMDRYVEAHGWVDDAGETPGFTKTYFAALNSARLALIQLAAHLKKSGKGEPSMVATLQAQARANVVPIRKGGG